MSLKTAVKSAVKSLYSSAGTQLEAIRADISAVQAEVAAVEASPLSLDEARERLAAYVDNHFPDATPVNEFFSAEHRAPSAHAGDMNGAGMIARLIGRQAILRHLNERLEATAAEMKADGIKPLTAGQRKARLSELNDKLHALCVAEEALIRDGEASGVVAILRRADASPAILLDVR
ncbi:hypothetical protein GGE65_004700 [Skermanella aerolata]|uniref:hypothetical protein n=1 Tax=Skermanella aerolata TaxID=393310 RepID=UPI003D25BA6C